MMAVDERAVTVPAVVTTPCAAIMHKDMFANLKDGSRKRSVDAVDGRTTLEETSSEVVLLLPC
jgi:hypothetical protein